ncbi:MAG: TonB-dependent receptor [Desulfuromonadaceae bacterium]|nr:TonB-dependent receptor [Desulfuromonadaceae bacterium]
MSAFADSEGVESLGIVEKSEEQAVSTARFPLPISKIAENVTVITAEQIANLNAHTLADVLQTVPGIEFDYLRTPTTFSFFNIQGALSTTVLVLIDGVRQNDFAQGLALPGLIPVQNIERIEIIKGSASAAWGNALGGVINIITKEPNAERPVSGLVSGSTGTKFTADSRAELSGTVDRFGYYLTAGNIRSDGLTPNTSTNLNNLYGKLTYRLPGNGTATLSLTQLDARPGTDEGDTAKWGWVHDNNEYHRTNGFLKFSQPLDTKLTLDVDGYFTYRDDHQKYGGLDGQGAVTFFNDFVTHETTRGTNARLTWGDSQRNVVTGIEYGHIQGRLGDLLNPPPTYDLTWDTWAFYANGAYTIDRLTILPGIRYDITGNSGDNTSYTLGATYRLAENTTLRASGASGFSLPQTGTSGPLQKVKTVQGGIESDAIPYLWLKGTYFYSTLRNSESGGSNSVTNQNRQGFEIEARTTSVYNLSLATGYTYLYAKNADSGAELQTNSDQSVPPHMVKLALDYNKSDLGLHGVLTGNYVWWNSPAKQPSQSSGMIWDLHLNWKLKPISGLSPELFFSGHNLLNGVQTTDTTLYTNPKRWFDGGIRVKF